MEDTTAEDWTLESTSPCECESAEAIRKMLGLKFFDEDFDLERRFLNNIAYSKYLSSTKGGGVWITR